MIRIFQNIYSILWCFFFLSFWNIRRKSIFKHLISLESPCSPTSSSGTSTVPRTMLIIFLLLCIPIISYSDTTSNLVALIKERNFNIKVKIINDAQSLKLFNNYCLSVVNSPLDDLNVPIKIEVENPETSKYYYRLIISEFKENDLSKAKYLAKVAQNKLKIDMEVLKLTGKKTIRTRYPDENVVYLVATQCFASKDLAVQWQEYISHFYSPYLYKEVFKHSSGIIKITDSNNNVLGTYENKVIFMPNKYLSTTIVSEIDKVNFGWWKIKRNEPYYRGGFEIYINDKGNLDVINTLHIDAYLYGVLPYEIGSTAPTETLKAQAIAARSEIIAKLATKQHFDDNFDFCSGQHCRVYNGSRGETNQTNRAVYDTSGIVLMRNGEIIDAVYSSSCGGVTAGPGGMWKQNVKYYLTSVFDGFGEEISKLPDLSTESGVRSFLSRSPDVFCNSSDSFNLPAYMRKSFRWLFSYDENKLYSLINKSYSVGKIRDIEVLARSETGRVQKIKIVGSKKNVLVDSELNIRHIFGNIYSTFFILVKKFDSEDRCIKQLTIKGAGFGHGIGMCQVGAFAMGQRGYTCEQILSHYYSDTTINKLY